MRVLGFDPGLSGAVAVLSGSDVLCLDDFPVHQVGVADKKASRAELDLHTLHTLLAEHWPFTHAFIEQASTRPGQGIVSAFRFGAAFGSLIGLLTALGSPLSLVQPKAWQRYHGIGPAPDAARQRATRLYPEIASKFVRKRDQHRADALLLADYGLHRLTSTMPAESAIASGHVGLPVVGRL